MKNKFIKSSSVHSLSSLLSQNSNNSSLRKRSIYRNDKDLINIDEKEEHLLLDFDSIPDAPHKQEYYVSEYDPHCEEHLQIEKIISLKENKLKKTLLIALNLLTFFLINLVIKWFPKLNLKLKYSQTNLFDATHLGVIGKDQQFQILKIEELNLPNIIGSHILDMCKNNINSFSLKAFKYKLFKYFYSTERGSFLAFNFEINSSNNNIIKRFSSGLRQREVEYQRKLFGKCDLEIQVDSIFKLISKDITDPFYIYQIFSIIYWFNNNYVNYALVIIFSTILSLLIGVYETKNNLTNICKMARYSCKIKIIRNLNGVREEKLSDSTELVPGDVFELPDDNFIIPCDCVLLNGSVIMNEAILTGESTPVTKQHIPNNHKTFNDKNYIIYSGTRIIQKRIKNGNKLLALSLKTGFNTNKGSLIRGILIPKENEFKIKEDSISYIKIMTCLSIVGFGISLPFMIKNGVPLKNVFFRAIDLITITVPPALPACIGIGISYALLRIKKKGIMCINRDRVNEAGKIDMICFDKTGTLTEDYLDIYGFVIIKYGRSMKLGNLIKNLNTLQEESYKYMKNKIVYQSNDFKRRANDLKFYLIECLAACHSITKVKDKMIGEPIDIKMFECTKWELSENLENENHHSMISTFVRPPQEVSIKDKLKSQPNEDEEKFSNPHYELEIIKRFDFSSKLQCMSVIVRDLNEENFKVYCKGSPEKIRDLCKSESIPENFNQALSKYTKKGYRVLALAFKIVKLDLFQSQAVSRERIENNLNFLGLLIVENKLKKETNQTINILKKANIKMIMSTGDNINTAISVAKDCNLLENSDIYHLDLVKNELNSNILCCNLVDNYESNDEIRDSLNSLDNTDFNCIYNKSPRDERLRISNFSAEILSIETQSPAVNNNEENFINLCYNDNMKSRSDSKTQFQYNNMDEIIIDNIISLSKVNKKFRLATTGNVFEFLLKIRNKYINMKSPSLLCYDKLFRFILNNCLIYARMSPENKSSLIENLKGDDCKVLMCGDGANDCGALRAANVGVSLSIEEASIAAHFTSKKSDISCLKDLLIEGKAALVTTIQCFKFMMLYSVIQFISVTIMVILGTYLSDNQFLMSDLFLIFPLAFLISKTEAVDNLTSDKPIADLKSISIISSIILQSVLQFTCQYFSFLLLKFQKWYTPLTVNENTECIDPSYENSTIFLISYLQYLITAVAFSIDHHFKKPIRSNYLLFVFLIIAFTYGYYLIISSDSISNWLFNIIYFNDFLYKSLIILLSLINFIVSILIEKYFVPAIFRIEHIMIPHPRNRSSMLLVYSHEMKMSYMQNRAIKNLLFYNPHTTIFNLHEITGSINFKYDRNKS